MYDKVSLQVTQDGKNNLSTGVSAMHNDPYLHRRGVDGVPTSILHHTVAHKEFAV